MRWRFVDLKNERECAARAAVTKQIEDWWREFERKAMEIDALFSQRTDWDLPSWMRQHLQTIDRNLMWEFGPAVNGAGHRLVITPECAHHLRPLTRTILDHAPPLSNWEFYDCRLPQSLETCRQSIKSRTGQETQDMRVHVRRGAHHRVDLTYANPSFTQANLGTAMEAGFVATETLLGEEFLNDWIGTIDATSMSRKPLYERLLGRDRAEHAHFLELDRLQATVHALVHAIREQLPADPHCDWIDGVEWTLWKLEPQYADDYACQDDLLVGKSGNAAQWTAAHSGTPFCSKRFSHCGELFCYLKLDGSQASDTNRIEDKSQLEDALDAILKPNRLGCHIGGGTGLRYSYIDLALTDVENGLRAIEECMQSLGVPKRSWIQFYDCDLAAEWIGIYDDTPPPPMSGDKYSV